MTVIALDTQTMAVFQYDNVSNVAYSSGTYTITYGGNTATRAADRYRLQILW